MIQKKRLKRIGIRKKEKYKFNFYLNSFFYIYII